MHRFHLLIAVLILLLGRTVLASIDVTDARIDTALDVAGDNRDEIRRALDDAPDDQRRYMRWLVAHMPPRDLQSLDAAFLLNKFSVGAGGMTPYERQTGRKWRR